MLALTECRRGMIGITAAAVRNPIFDWTALFPEDVGNVSSKMSKMGPVRKQPYEETTSVDSPNTNFLSVEDLLALRNCYFHKPENYFDPFASPSLFFRTASSELPYDSPFKDFSGARREEEKEEEYNIEGIVKKRTSPRKYPPSSSLLLPSMRVEVGKDYVLKEQCLEFIELMRRSYRRTELDPENLVKSPAYRIFEVVERKELGLWDGKDVTEMGNWFGEVLRKT